ncbi:MAG: DUF2939 domain-containing protein [Pseudoxanthomonas sp.]
MKKWIALALVILIALVGYVAAGPYLAINGIRQALAEQDTGKLERHVDFPALRVSIKAQVQDSLARRAGSEAQSNLFGAIALSIAGSALGSGVDAMVTPLGIGALLQGRSMWKQSLGETVDGDTYGKAVPADPLKDAEHHYESPSRFTATVHDENGKPMVFVFKRTGLRWKLADIRLPL